MEDEEPQGALFTIEGPDEDGCVWILVDGETVNLGPRDAVAERWVEWLSAIDYGDL